MTPFTVRLEWPFTSHNTEHSPLMRFLGEFLIGLSMLHVEQSLEKKSSNEEKSIDRAADLDIHL